MRWWEGRVPVGEEGVITATTATIMERIRAWLPVVSKEILVDGAAAFRPERWFEEDKDRLARMIKTSDMIFGHGSWSCLETPIAPLEMTKTIFEVGYLVNIQRRVITDLIGRLQL